MSVVSAHSMRTALNGAMEARALGDAEARRLYNPDCEINSLAERMVALRRYGVPGQVLREIFNDLRVIVRLNSAQTREDAQVAGQLDEMATALHRASTSRGERALGVKAVARALRPALSVIASPAGFSAAEYVRAVRDVDRIVASTPRSMLLGISVRHELGAGRHDLLTELAEAS